MDSDFMATMANKLAAENITVVRFEFPYMQERRQTGKKRPPNRMPQLLESFLSELDEVCTEYALPLFIGGKSMGGRVASMLPVEFARVVEKVRGVVCYGYPFHPPAKPENLRIEHFGQLTLPVKIFQGTRDKFGLPEEVAGYDLPQSVDVQWVPTGDHDLKPTKASGLGHIQVLDQVARDTAEFMRASS